MQKDLILKLKDDFSKTEKEYSKNRTYQKVTDNCELFAVQNMLTSDNYTIIKTIIYDKFGNIYDTLFSWNFNLLFDYIEKGNDTEEAVEIINNFTKKLNAFLSAYSIQNGNSYLIDIWLMLNFSEKEFNKIPLWIAISTQNLEDYFLLSEESIHVFNSWDKDFSKYYKFKEALAINDNNDPTFHIVLWNNLVNGIYEYLEENGVNEDGMIDINKMNYNLKKNSDVILEIAKIKDSKKDEARWELLKRFFPIDSLTTDNDIVMSVMIRNKKGFSSKFDNEVSITIANNYIFNNIEELKKKIKDIFSNLEINNKYSIIFIEDNEEINFEEWIFIPKYLE